MASVHATESLLFSVLLQLILMLGAARGMNAVFRRLGQPGVVGEIVAGLMLGPSLFGHFFPGAEAALFGRATSQPVIIISQIGLILLMFQIGCDFEFAHLRNARHRVTALAVAAASVGVPLLCGLGFGQLSAASLAPGIDPWLYSLFCAVAFAITAVPILGRILREVGLTRDVVGVIAIAAAAINDVTVWLLLAGVSAYATAAFDRHFVIVKLGALALFAILFLAVLRPGVAWLLRRTAPARRDALPPGMMAVVLCLVFALGMATSAMGVFAIFGGFAAGLLFHHDADFVEHWQRQVGQFVLVFFLPVFFTFTGLRTNLLGLSAHDLAWLGLLLAAAILGKILPVALAARLRGLPGSAAWVLGVLMNTRALMALIVLNIGLDLGYIPPGVFTLLVVMAVVTTIMAGPALRLLLPRMGHAIPAAVPA